MRVQWNLSHPMLYQQRGSLVDLQKKGRQQSCWQQLDEIKTEFMLYIHEHVISQLEFSELVYHRNVSIWHRVCGHRSENRNLTGNLIKADDDEYPHIWGIIPLWR